MFIKEITLCGFKSYKEKTTIADLCDGLNVILGRNGSGKSNIFAAIEFALTLEYRHMKSDARSSLIPHGRQNADPSYVEIVFDNSDRKLMVNSDTVTFRRILALKKDKFLVNGKEVVNAKQFLDIAGFTNPYFIVKQGKVHDLALATDQARLKILSDVMGTSAYDEKIEDCQRCLKSSEEKWVEVEKMLAELKERKDTLEAEVADQKLYIQLDQTKRGLEFVISGRKTKELQKDLDNLELKRKECSKKQRPIRSEVEAVSRNLQIFKRDLGEMEGSIKQLHDLKQDFESNVRSIAADIESHKQELQDCQARNKRPEKPIVQLEKEIEKTEKLIEKSRKEVSALKRPLDELLIEKCRLDAQAKVIQEKAYGKEKWKNKAAEYDRHLRDKRTDIEQLLTSNKKRLSDSISADNDANENVILETENVQKLRENLSTFTSEISALNKQLEQNKTLECTAKGQLEILHRELSELEQSVRNKRDRLTRLEEECKRSFGAAVWNGWMGIRKIIEDFKNAGSHPEVVEGYYGLVCEIVECDSKLDSAVEAAGGKKLVHQVVQSHEIAECILDEFNRRKLKGECNFISINQLKETNYTIPDKVKGVKSILEELQFDRKFSSVVKFVFGNTLLCANLERATEMMRQYKLPCVTVEGEKVSKVGVMTGGYRRSAPQKLELQRARATEEQEFGVLSNRKSDLDVKCRRLREDHGTLKQQHEKFRNQKADLERKKRQMISSIETTEKQISSYKRFVKEGERKRDDLKLNIAALEEKLKMFKSKDGDENMAEVLEKIRDIGNKCNKAEQTYTAKELEMTSLEARLQQLYKQYYLEHDLSSSQNDKDVREAQIQRFNQGIILLRRQTLDIQTQIDRADKEISVLQESASRKRKQVEELTEKETKLMEELRSLCTTLESHATKYERFQTRLQEHIKESGQLGTMPQNVDRYEALEDRVLYSKLKKTNLKLKNVVKVGFNHMAVEQSEELTRKYGEFIKRMEVYKKEKVELVALLRDLENKKGEAMLKNVRQMQEQFQDIFCRIVPKGNAQLILYGPSITVDQEQNIESDDLREMAGQNLFEGVRISVNFIGKDLHNLRNLTPLSGGQKSVIALCLILAIQTIDPVPFYLFDEVDQALDTEYRNSVARVISEMAERSQFICTTFRKEFVGVADKVFGVSYRQTHSYIQPVTDTQAMDFVESDQNSDSMDVSPPEANA